MSAQIYATPATIPDPPWDDYNNESGKFDFKRMVSRDEKYLDELRAWLKAHGYTSPYAGEVVRWGYADGAAQYMVMSLRPLKLMHLTLMDGWRMPDIFERGLTAKDIRDQVDSERRTGAR